MKPTLAIFIILTLFLGVMYFTKDAGYKQREQEREIFYKDSIERIRGYYEERLATDSITFIHYGIARQDANEAIKEANYLRNQLAIERKKNRRFTDQATDSLLSMVN